MAKYTGSFRSTQWDPYLLISQIIALQALLYVSLGNCGEIFPFPAKLTVSLCISGTIMFFMDFLAEANHTLDHIFEYHASRR
jgi:hypothetical protein